MRAFGEEHLLRQPSAASLSSQVIDEQRVVTTTEPLPGGRARPGTEGGFAVEGSLVSASVHHDMSRTLAGRDVQARASRSAAVKPRLDATYPGTGGLHTPMNHAFRDRVKELELGPGYINSQDRYRPARVVRGGGLLDREGTARLQRQRTAPALWPQHRTLNDGSPWEGGAVGLQLRERHRDEELGGNYFAIGGNKGTYAPTQAWKGGGAVDSDATRRLWRQRSASRLRTAGSKWERAEIVEDAEAHGVAVPHKLVEETAPLRRSASFRGQVRLRTTGSVRTLPRAPSASFRTAPLTKSMRHLLTGDRTGAMHAQGTEAAGSGRLSPISNGQGMARAASSPSVRRHAPPRTAPASADAAAASARRVSSTGDAENGMGNRSLQETGLSMTRSRTSGSLRLVRPEAGEYDGAVPLVHFRQSHWRPEEPARWVAAGGWNARRPGVLLRSGTVGALL